MAPEFHLYAVSMKIDAKKEIVVTIVCSVIVSITAVISAFIAREHVTRYDVKIVPRFELVSVTDYFPLKVGNAWLYKGRLKEAVMGQSEAIEIPAEVTMKVINLVKGQHASLYIMQGHPSDAAWSLTEKDVNRSVKRVTPSRYGYFVVSNKIFMVDENKIDRIADALRNKEGLLDKDILSYGDLEFEFPLFEGQKFGELNQLARGDLRYCWYVESSTIFHSPEGDKVKAIPSYKLLQNTLPGYVEMEFTPYLGITSYTYSHHGTPAQLDLSLEKYHIHLQE